MKAIFCESEPTNHVVDLAAKYNYVIKILPEVRSDVHKSFKKHLNYRLLLEYSDVIILENNDLPQFDIFRLPVVNSIALLKAPSCSNCIYEIEKYAKCLDIQKVINNSCETSFIAYNNVRHFLPLFQRIEQFCNMKDDENYSKIRIDFGSNEIKTPNFLSPELEKTLFCYFAIDMYPDNIVVIDPSSKNNIFNINLP